MSRAVNRGVLGVQGVRGVLGVRGVCVARGVRGVCDREICCGCAVGCCVCAVDDDGIERDVVGGGLCERAVGDGGVCGAFGRGVREG